MIAMMVLLRRAVLMFMVGAPLKLMVIPTVMLTFLKVLLKLGLMLMKLMLK